MAILFTGNDSDGIVLTNNSDLWINQVNTFVAGPGDVFRFENTSSNRLVVYGNILSPNGSDAITSLGDSSSLKVEIAATGTVSGGSDGIQLGGNAHIVTNYGTITAYGDNGVEMQGDDSNQFNSSRIINLGLITSTYSGVYAAYIGNFIYNSGEIRGSVYGAIFSESINNTLVNNGLISGDVAIIVFGIADTDAVHIYNSGTLSGRIAMSGSPGVDEIFNSGSIIGSSQLGAGNDIVHNTGTILGAIDLGTGNDTLRSANGLIAGVINGGFGEDKILSGTGDDEVHGGSEADSIRGNSGSDLLFGDGGEDTIFGGEGDDTIDGGTESDTLYGNDGADMLSGGDHIDLLYGGQGDDTLDGGGANDKLYGGNGEDQLLGGFAADQLWGGAGDDVLIGGRQADQLTGGSGADLFAFGKFDSGLGTNSDVIHDFQKGLDSIDLSDVIPGVLTFVGSGAFAGGGTASVRVLIPSSGQTSIFVDHNGDGTADMRILLDNHPVLTEGDFIL